jgi:hypothetical protein
MTYTFTALQLVQVLKSVPVQVEANSYDEARNILIQTYELSDNDDTFSHMEMLRDDVKILWGMSRYIEDTGLELQPSEMDGLTTLEFIDSDGYVFYTNTEGVKA